MNRTRNKFSKRTQRPLSLAVQGRTDISGHLRFQATGPVRTGDSWNSLSTGWAARVLPPTGADAVHPSNKLFTPDKPLFWQR